MVGYAANHSPYTDKAFKHEPGKAGKITVTRNVRWVHWDHPNKSKSMDLSPLFTKAEGLNKDQKALFERSIDTFIIDNKMCSKKFTNPSNHQKNSLIQIVGGKWMITTKKRMTLKLKDTIRNPP
jgi:hypothetical protein